MLVPEENYKLKKYAKHWENQCDDHPKRLHSRNDISQLILQLLYKLVKSISNIYQGTQNRNWLRVITELKLPRETSFEKFQS